MNPQEWLLRWFRNNKPGAEPALHANYFEAGLVDSFGVITLVGEIEDEFDVRFDELDFQDRRFSTIDGLAAIISESLEKKRSAV